MGPIGTLEKAASRITACDLCGGASFQTIGEFDRNGNRLQTVVCRDCGLVSHASIPSDQELAEYYRYRYRQEYNNEYTPSAFRFLREWKRGRRRFERLEPFLNPSDAVFEVGAGMGCNLKHFELAGFDVSGIEPGDGFRHFACEQLHMKIDGRILDELPQMARYDFVLLVHVLEHFTSPTRALRHIRGILNPGGRLYVEVPNLEAPHAAPGKLFHYAHIYNFTRTALGTVARATGFTVDAILSDPREKNLAMLLSVSDSCALKISPRAHRDAVEATRRYNILTYHLNGTYLRERWLSIREVLMGRFGAGKEVSRILAALTKPRSRGVAEDVSVAGNGCMGNS